MNHQAKALNERIINKNKSVYHMLSDRGRGLYFPYLGILGQGAAAKGKTYNATIGLANEDDGSPMRLSYFDTFPLAPAEVLPYAPSQGLPALRQRWKELIYEKNKSLSGIDISQPVVTQALTHGISLAAQLFLNPGEEVVIPTPFWDNYSLIFQECTGARIHSFSCFENGAFNLKGFSQCLEERKGKKVVFLFNAPNNPTGYTPTEAEAERIVELCKSSAEQGTQIVFIADDAYFGLVYESGVVLESLFAMLARAHQNILAVKVDGVTKEDYAWGLRVGFMTFAAKDGDSDLYKALEDKVSGLIRGMISNCSQMSQSVVLKALTHPDYQPNKEAKYATLKQRYETLKHELSNHPEYGAMFKPLPYNSGYFMCLELDGKLDSEKVRQRLLDHYDTGVVVLGPLVRVAFSCVAELKIPELIKNIYQACLDLKSA